MGVTLSAGPKHSVRSIGAGLELGMEGQESYRLLSVGLAAESPVHFLFRQGQGVEGAHEVKSVRDALRELHAADYGVVLAAETLPDGSGYELRDAVARAGKTLFVGVPLSEGSLWLPVVDCGNVVLGHRGMNVNLLEAELDRRLQEHGVRPKRDFFWVPGMAPKNTRWKGLMPPRRRAGMVPARM